MPATSELAKHRRLFYGLSAGFLLALSACGQKSPTPQEIAQAANNPPTNTQQPLETSTSIPPSPPPSPTPARESTPVSPSGGPTATGKPTETPAPQKLNAADIPEVATAIAKKELAAPPTKIVYSTIPGSTNRTSIPLPIQSIEPTPTPTIPRQEVRTQLKLEPLWTQEIFIPENKDLGFYSPNILLDNTNRLFYINGQGNIASFISIDHDKKDPWISSAQGFLINVDHSLYNIVDSDFNFLYFFNNNNLSAMDSKNGKIVWTQEITKGGIKPSNFNLSRGYIALNLWTRVDNTSKPYSALVLQKSGGEIIRTFEGQSFNAVEGNTVVVNGKGISIINGQTIFDLKQIEPQLESKYLSGIFLQPWLTYNINATTNHGAILGLYTIEKGQRIWRSERPERKGSYYIRYVNDKRIYLAYGDSSQNSHLTVINIATGKEWSYQTPDPSIQFGEINGIMVASLTNSKTTIGFNAETGEKLWESRVLHPKQLGSAIGPYMSPDGTKAIIVYYLGSDTKNNPELYDEIKLIDLKTGKQIWSYKAKGSISSSFSSGKYYLANEGGKLLILDMSSGNIIPNNFVNISGIYETKDLILVQTGQKGQKGELTAISLS